MASTTPQIKPTTPRNLRAHPPVNASPVTFTDQTCFDIIGLVADQMRRIVRKHGIRHMVDGQRMIVRTDDWLAFLERNATGADFSNTGEVDQPADEPTADALLARIGMRRTA